MLVRWYQAGIFEPFFRAHAHIDTKRREPFLLSEPERSHVRELIKLRYKMLPIWYTAFKENKATGLPLLRPQFLMFPEDQKGAGIGDQYYLGDSGLLVKPAVVKDATTVDVYLAEDEVSRTALWQYCVESFTNLPTIIWQSGLLQLLHA